jgi:acetate kinase
VLLVLNAGSSSIKFSVYDDGESGPALRLHGQLAALNTSPRFTVEDATGAIVGEHAWGNSTQLGHEGALEYLAEYLGGRRGQLELVGVGHRVVHGGARFSGPVRLDAAVIEELSELSPLAPLHQPHNLAAIRILAERQPRVPQVACFDTAFHLAQPELARAIALPRSITERGVRRYGFHGLSYEYIAGQLPSVDERAATGRAVVAHLGNGASMCAMAAGKCVATTMGFSAVDGLPMGTRSGSVDPGVMLYLMDELALDARAVEKLIYEQSGLLGVSGISSDMRTLLASDDPHARFAVDLFVYRIGRELGSLAAALGGVDAVVFTGGIGEHAAVIRERVCRDAAWVGVELDLEANAAGGPRISAEGSRAGAWVIPTDEELMIARHTRRVIRANGAAE